MNKTADILVIDDEHVIIDAVVKICALENYTVDTALNTKTGLEKIEKNYYSIVLSDIMMPDGDGFEILEAVNSKKNDTVVIMTTGFSTVENAVNSLYKGAISFIPKPFTVDELLSTLYRISKYQKIFEKQKLLNYQNKIDELLYVSCPAKYLRLGHSTWLLQEREGTVLVGICDIYIKSIDSIQKLELLEIDEEIAQGIHCASFVCSNDRNHRILSPVSGRIVEVNSKVKDDVSIIEKDPYFEGWLYRVIPANLDYEIKNLIPCSSDR